MVTRFEPEKRLSLDIIPAYFRTVNEARKSKSQNTETFEGFKTNLSKKWLKFIMAAFFFTEVCRPCTF